MAKKKAAKKAAKKAVKGVGKKKAKARKSAKTARSGKVRTHRTYKDGTKLISHADRPKKKVKAGPTTGRNSTTGGAG